MKNKMPAIHPGEILRDEIEEIGLSANALANKLQVPTNRITGILNGQRAVTADTAIRLACFFKTSAEFWLKLQTDFDLKIAWNMNGKKIRKTILPFDEAA